MSGLHGYLVYTPSPHNMLLIRITNGNPGSGKPIVPNDLKNGAMEMLGVKSIPGMQSYTKNDIQIVKITPSMYKGIKNNAGKSVKVDGSFEDESQYMARWLELFPLSEGP